MRCATNIIILIGLLAIQVFADPEPTGGASCVEDYDCGGLDAGSCLYNSTLNETVCVCPDDLANPNCTYQRIDRNLAGGLQFLCFAGIGGVGNFVLGRTGEAVGQLILMFAYIFGICAICFVFCCDGELGGMIGGIVGCVLCSAVLAGFIWCIVDGALILQGKIDDGNGYSTFG
ncbi:hypothetical protein QKU48_gp1352 [Fadolivirus algeromassiliense]|jgi:hypothetical protein|uniref:TM2 domain-containing protein n=1 Tax=Fadolivirus FV1/VV64 TaxID=3070911 RepID=A0A7D3UU24_9VIRU|nr:hypothetical protein QKU48_gp1352 [Fadolivirus algeromassiliense]QKF94810.1 hypothetical protein Fadolivirus_1_1352 [Fadolivirus FV1/VV64]